LEIKIKVSFTTKLRPWEIANTISKIAKVKKMKILAIPFASFTCKHYNWEITVKMEAMSPRLFLENLRKIVEDELDSWLENDEILWIEATEKEWKAIYSQEQVLSLAKQLKGKRLV